MINKILIVDDEHVIGEVLVQLLRDEGYKVVYVDNGLDAITYLKKTNTEPCLVLLDMMMPVMNGWQVLEKIKDLNAHKRIAVAIFTVNTKITYVEGTIGIINKPVNLDTLLEFVSRYCKSK